MRPSLLLAALLFASPLGAADGDTSATLTLGDFFDLKPGDPGFRPRLPAYDPEGPVLLIPDTRLWRVPLPTPTPTPVPEDPRVAEMELPRLPMRIQKPRESDVEKRPPFISRGRAPGVIATDRSRVLIVTGNSTLRYAIELTPTDAAGAVQGTTMRLLHGPSTDETIELPAGHWRLAITAWRPTAPQRAAAQEWVPFRLADELYELTIDEKVEQEFLRRLERRGNS